MSQHDYNIANQAGAAVRSDLNNVFGAIATLNSGATAPSTTFAYQPWIDTATGVLKHRNAANSGWIVSRTVDETFVLSRSSNTMLDVSDKGKVIRATGSFTQTFDAVATLGDGWYVLYINEGSGVITLDPNASETIDGATTLALNPGESALIACNGTNLATLFLRRPLTLGTEQATTSGTSIDFTGVPSWVKRITVMFDQVSVSGADTLLLQIGDSGGVENTGYVSTAMTLQNGSGVSGTEATAGFALNSSGLAAADLLSGSLVLTLEDAANNTWTMTGTLRMAGSVSNTVMLSAGRKALSAVLDRVRLTSTGGAVTFDAGAANIMYE